jgi:hypothetical protein
MPPHDHRDFLVATHCCGRSRLLRLGRPRGAVTFPRLCELYIYIYIYIYIYKSGVSGGALNLNSTSYPDHGRYGVLPLQGKIPTAKPVIEHGTSRLVVRNSDHQATRLVIMHSIVIYNLQLKYYYSKVFRVSFRECTSMLCINHRFFVYKFSLIDSFIHTKSPSKWSENSRSTLEF